MTTLKISTNNEPTQSVLKYQKALEDEVNKPKRKRITPEQFCLLSNLFHQSDTPSFELRERLAKKLDMTNREVQVWFQNRRAKVNRLKQQTTTTIPEAEAEAIHENKDQVIVTAIATEIPSLLTIEKKNSQVKFSHYNYYYNSSNNSSNSSSNNSSNSSSPLPPHDHLLYFDSHLAPIDILATAAAYVQQLDRQEYEEQRKRKRDYDIPAIKKHKSWRPWL